MLGWFGVVKYLKVNFLDFISIRAGIPIAIFIILLILFSSYLLSISYKSFKSVWYVKAFVVFTIISCSIVFMKIGTRDQFGAIIFDTNIPSATFFLMLVLTIATLILSDNIKTIS